jgi:long-chain acyl-CoA synthetase
MSASPMSETPRSVPRGTAPYVLTFTELLLRAYRRHARRTAVIDGDVRLTFGELEARARAVTAGLQSRGVTAGERVVMVLSNGHRFFPVEHACYLGGWVRVALSPRLHPEEIADIVADCTAAVLVTEAPLVQQLAVMRDRMPALRLIVGVDSSSTDDWVALDELAADPEAAKLNEPRPDDVMALVYTSGTTGRPKGVMLSHSQWIPMTRNLMVDLPPIDERDVMLHVGPLSHLSGYIAGIFFFQGATQVIAPTFTPESTLEAIERHRVTVLAAVPTMLNMMLPLAERGTGDYSSLRVVFYGAAPIAPDRLVRALAVFGSVFVQGFGQSELGLPITTMSARAHEPGPDGRPPERLASAGRPTPWVDLRIVDDDRNDVPVGEVGEIFVKSESTMSGYWNKPHETQQTVHDGWVLTGDLGRLDDDGYLYIVDRKKDMVVSGGFNVYPTEIENLISGLPGVAEVAVVGVPHEQWGETLLAAVVRSEGAELTEQDVQEACAAQLAGYKKPRIVEFLDALPKTATGKIQRRKLRDRYWHGHDRRVGG